jgi:hypothetical protein
MNVRKALATAIFVGILTLRGRLSVLETVVNSKCSHECCRLQQQRFHTMRMDHPFTW